MLSTFTGFSFPRSTQLRPFNTSLIYVPLLSPLLASVYLRFTCLRVRVIPLFLFHFLITFSLTFSHRFLLLRFFLMSLFLRYFSSRLTDPFDLSSHAFEVKIFLSFFIHSRIIILPHRSLLFVLLLFLRHFSLFIPFSWPHLTSLSTPPKSAYFILLLHFLTSFLPLRRFAMLLSLRHFSFHFLDPIWPRFPGLRVRVMSLSLLHSQTI